MSDEIENTSTWWETLYDELLADVLLDNHSTDEIDATCNFLFKALDLVPDDRIFDQCCGTGRLSNPLALMGFKVTAVDLIPIYIDKARKSNSPASFHVGDAFEFTCNQPCDAGFNWWTSFGYTKDDTTNLKMLQCAAKSIKPGGKFALDFMNVPGVIAHFKPEVITRTLHPEKGEILLIRESEIDPAAGLMNKKWNYILESGKRTTHCSSVKLYDPPTLSRLFKEAGFKHIEIFGDLDGSTLTLDSPRCIVVGTRK